MEDISPQPTSTSDQAVMQNSNDISGSAAHSASSKSFLDVTSDNEASEGPIREKLKKTSIASIPKENNMYSTADIEEQIQSHPGRDPRSDPISTGGSQELNAQNRGRLLRKRSSEDTATDKETLCKSGDTITSSLEGRERKRSKDVHTSRIPRADTHEQGPIRSPVPEEAESEECADMYDQPRPNELPNDDSDIGARQPAMGEDSTDQEMRDHPFSPRKKRSRDPLDTDPHREQKIVATEEARAHRRSEEYERGKNFPDVAKGEQVDVPVVEEPAPANAEHLPIKEVFTILFD